MRLLPQALAAGPQAEQDGTGNWRGMLKKGEDAPGSGPGSPLKGAVNLLDVVSLPVPLVWSPKVGVALTSHPPPPLLCAAGAGGEEAVLPRAEGLRGHRTPHQILLPDCPEEHPGQVGRFGFSHVPL